MTTTRELATLLGVHPTTIGEARRQRRLVLIGGLPRLYSRRACGHCGQRRNIRGANCLCTACRTAGWRWCSLGRHSVPIAALARKGTACLTCWRRYDAMWHRGGTPDPPPGFISLRELAAHLHYSQHALADRIRDGWAVEVWRRTPRSGYYVRQMDTYPVFGRQG